MASLTIVKTVDHCHECEKRPDTEETVFANESVCLSTKYYRKNKVSRDKIHKCPHCDYETTGPKQTLINHINAKHKAEKDKPFYCACCDKGFAQAANYEKHMKNIHGEIVKVTKTREQRKPYMYVITMGNYLPSSKNTIARVEYYRSNKHIRAEDLGKIVYKEGKVLLQKDIHYDRKTGYIGFTAYTKTDYDEFIKKQETDCVKETDITAVEKSENISSKKTADKKIEKKIQKKKRRVKTLTIVKSN